MSRWRLTTNDDVFVFSQRQSWASSEELGGYDQIIGLAGDDVIVADSPESGRNWSIFGELGNDYIVSSFSNDTIGGNEGNDTIDGGDDEDLIWGDAGNDHITGAEGRDTLYGGDGNDLIAGDLFDSLIGEYLGLAFDDLIFGGAGNDTIKGGQGGDTIFGDAGEDLIFSPLYLDEVVYIYAGAGADTIIGSLSGDTDGEGSQVLFGGEDNAADDIRVVGYGYAYGEGGNDTIIGGDTYHAGDVGIYSNHLFGGDGNDLILSGRGEAEIWGGAGNDRLEGRNGGMNRIDGEDGDDTIIGGGNAHGGAGNDLLENGGAQWGWSGDDTIIGGGANRGGDGNDSIVGSYSRFMWGGNGDDWIIDLLDGCESMCGEAGNDTLQGGDSMWGGEGNDSITAGFNQEAWGEAGNDTLIGIGSGATLVGMEGNDLLIGTDSSLSIDRTYIIHGRGNDTILASSSDRVYTSWFEIAAGERDVFNGPVTETYSASFHFESSMAAYLSVVAVTGGTAIRIDTEGGTYYEMFVQGYGVTDVNSHILYF